MKDFDHLPLFYKDILLFFNELKVLYDYNNFSDMILFNNKDILIGGKPSLFKEWLKTEGLQISINPRPKSKIRFSSYFSQ